MKQLLLATALIAVPLAGFTGFKAFEASASVTANAPAASLGDLSPFATIVTEVQGTAAKGDIVAAKARIKDFEIAWDQSEKGLKPMDPNHWGMIDEAADAAFTAIRAKSPNLAIIAETLTALQATLIDQPVVSK